MKRCVALAAVLALALLALVAVPAAVTAQAKDTLIVALPS